MINYKVITEVTKKDIGNIVLYTNKGSKEYGIICDIGKEPSTVYVHFANNKYPLLLNIKTLKAIKFKN